MMTIMDDHFSSTREDFELPTGPVAGGVGNGTAEGKGEGFATAHTTRGESVLVRDFLQPV